MRRFTQHLILPIYACDVRHVTLRLILLWNCSHLSLMDLADIAHQKKPHHSPDGTVVRLCSYCGF